ncbi:MAG: bifunctional DNA primase/helicase [Crocinitomicaceae bacterium]|nr:bifunctional DNA primase/helicase [Crocinitomicaceae bacterium]MBP6032756.1 bifunctional DNA primase/helicase [Crocinitomicaceae bacterium]
MSNQDNFKLSKDQILLSTNRGLDVFKYFLGSRFSRVGKSFKSPFYNDNKASCYVYLDKKSNIYKFKDFGDAEYSGDCFFFVGKIFGYSCEDRSDFYKILEVIDLELSLNTFVQELKIQNIIENNKGTVLLANKIKSIHDGFETAKNKLPIQYKDFTIRELDYWGKYGIKLDTLKRYNVQSIESYNGISKDGREFLLTSSPEQPIYGYQGRRYTKLYRPFSKLRFLYTGEITENYIFGFEQLPVRGDILFITGGEKDVLSLASHGLNAICLNSETAHIPKNLLRGLNYRFKHITLLYDVDDTGKNSMDKLTKEYKSFKIKSLLLPLSGTKQEKDVSDFFRLKHTSEDLMMLFMEMLDSMYEDTISVMRSCEIDFKNPPKAPEPLITINDVTIGTPGNILCIAGSEGSGKTNFLGGMLSGALKPDNTTVDTLGTFIQSNEGEKAILLYDTEQSEFQLYKNISYIIDRSQRSAPPRWFKAFGLVGISRNERMNLILESMDRLYYEHGGIHMVVIDGIADLLNGVNDEESSVKLIEELFRMAAIYNTCILCVVHMAPSGMKLRGHLGSEVQRKAAGILLVEKETNTNYSVVKALKVRDGSPLDVPLIQFGWDKAQGRHVYLGNKSKEESESRKINELSEVAREIFAKKSVLGYSELLNAVMEALDIKDRMARNYIRFMKDNGIIEKSNGITVEYSLSSGFS